MATTQTQTTWPEGVIARYLTLGGATVDIVQAVAHHEKDESGLKDLGNGFSAYRYPREVIDLTLVARCNGCPDSDKVEYEGIYASALDGLLEGFYGRDAQCWAQAHAEKCRAMPRPTTA